MTPTDRPAAIQATMEDRISASNFGRHISRLTRKDAEAILAGSWDHTEDVQAFARHRLTTEARLSPAATGEGVREACARIVDAFADGQQQMIDEEGPDQGCEDWKKAFQLVSERIRALPLPVAKAGEQAIGTNGLRGARKAFATIYDKLCAYEGSWPTHDARAAKSAFYAALAALTPSPVAAGEIAVSGGQQEAAQQAQVERAVTALPAGQLAAVNMTLAGMEQHEIAAVRRITQQGVSDALRKAVQTLRIKWGMA